MPITMPKLEEGRVYHREEVADYIAEQSGTSDFVVMDLHFPIRLDNFEHDPSCWRDGEEILLQYRVFPMDDFRLQICLLVETYRQHRAEWQRVEVIVKLLQAGASFFPVILQQNDPKLRIVEGYHRAAALFSLSSCCLPAFLAGYRDWFTNDELKSDLNSEDKSVQASRKNDIEATKDSE